jgi:GNAT superfamily N-acetyltransferase
MHEAEITIRHYQQEDRPYVRDLAWDTALIGEPAAAFFNDKEILADFLTLYFTDYEPESCFVAESESRLVGYLLGAKDTAALDRVAKWEIAPRLLVKSLAKGTFLKKKNVTFAFRLLASFFKGEFVMPGFYKEYPATLHINLEKKFRNLGIGSKLMGLYLEYLTRQGIPGVYIPTMSDKAASFFRKQGFNFLYRGYRSYFRHILHKDLPLYIYGKRL